MRNGTLELAVIVLSCAIVGGCEEEADVSLPVDTSVPDAVYVFCDVNSPHGDYQYVVKDAAVFAQRIPVSEIGRRQYENIYDCYYVRTLPKKLQEETRRWTLAKGPIASGPVVPGETFPSRTVFPGGPDEPPQIVLFAPDAGLQAWFDWLKATVCTEGNRVSEAPGFITEDPRLREMAGDCPETNTR